MNTIPTTARIARTELESCTISLVRADGEYEVAVRTGRGEWEPVFSARHVDLALARFHAEGAVRGVTPRVLKFEPGETYVTTSVCDSDCVYTMRVVSRTDKTVKTITNGKPRTYRTSVYGGAERVSMGSYSMAAGFSALHK